MLEQKIDDLIAAIERLATTFAQHSRVEEIRIGNDKTVPAEPEPEPNPAKQTKKAKSKVEPEPEPDVKPEPGTQPVPSLDELQKLALSIVRMDTGAKPRVMVVIESHGAEQLRDIPEANRHALHGALLKLAVDVSAEQEDAT